MGESFVTSNGNSTDYYVFSQASNTKRFENKDKYCQAYDCFIATEYVEVVLRDPNGKETTVRWLLPLVDSVFDHRKLF